MKRFGMTLRLKPGKSDIYKTYHAAVWPEVLDKIKECNIRNYSIFFEDDILFSYFEYHGDDMKADWAKMAAHSKTQEWWAIMEHFNHPKGRRVVGGDGASLSFGLKYEAAV
jgi:L-rhamnose mutarotase